MHFSFPVLLTAMYLYSGPVLIAVVFAYVTYHVLVDWRERVQTASSSPGSASDDDSSPRPENRHCT